MPDGAFLLDGDLAPFHRTLAQGPEYGSAQWVTAEDGVRLRAVSWGRDAPRGTVLIFSGRTEYAEKYGRVAAELVINTDTFWPLSGSPYVIADDIRVTGTPLPLPLVPVPLDALTLTRCRRRRRDPSCARSRS